MRRLTAAVLQCAGAASAVAALAFAQPGRAADVLPDVPFVPTPQIVVDDHLIFQSEESARQARVPLPGGSRTVEVELNQHFQEVNGLARIDGHVTQLQATRVN